MPYTPNPFDHTGTVDTSGYGAPTTTPSRYRLPISNAGAEVGESTFLDGYDDSSIAVVTNWSLTTNVVTLTTAANHGLTTGQRVVVLGVDPYVDGTYVLASGATTTMTFALVKPNVGSTPIVNGEALVGIAVPIYGIAGLPQSGGDVSPSFGMTAQVLKTAVATLQANGTQYTPTGVAITGGQSQNVT